MENSLLTSQETEALKASAVLWNHLILLPIEHPDDIPTFRKCIHEIQAYIMMRPVRREDIKIKGL